MEKTSVNWYWQDYGDGSGGLRMPNGKSIAGYDISTGEIWLHNYNTGKYNSYFTEPPYNLQTVKEAIIQKIDNSIDDYLSKEMRQFAASFDISEIKSLYQPEVDYEKWGDLIIFKEIQKSNEKDMLKKDFTISLIKGTAMKIEIKNNPEELISLRNIEFRNGLWYQYVDIPLPDQPLSELLDENTILLNEDTLRGYYNPFTTNDITAISYESEKVQLKEGSKQMSAYDKACISAEAHQIVENKIKGEWDAAIDEVMQSVDVPEPDMGMEM